LAKGRSALLAYELFERVAVRVDTPNLSIAPGGRIAFNAAACRLLLDAKIRTVVILWDKDASRMAIKTAPRGERNAFGISFTGANHSASLTAKLFLRHIGWSASKRVALATTWNAGAKMFEATLPPQYLATTSLHGKRRADT
jgi:hypothetical protein